MKDWLTRKIARLAQYLSSDFLSFNSLRRILLPILWEQVFLAALPLFSLWLLSFDGENAISVVNMMAVVNKVFSSVCLGLVTGGTVLVAQNIGADRKDDAGRSMGQAMGFAVFLTVLAGLLLLAGRGPLVGYLLAGAGEEIISQATVFFAGFCISFPCYAIYQSFAGAMRGWGKSKTAWRLTLSVNCAELLLTALFLLGMKLGVLGITLAMAISRLLGAVAAAVLMFRQRGELRLRLRAFFTPSKAILKSMLAIAIPLALEQFFFNGGKAVSQRFIAGYGAAHMAANGVVNAIFDLVNIPQAALRETLVTVVGMCIGSGRAALARRYVYRFLRTIRVSIVCLMPVTMPLAALLIHAYGLSMEANRVTILCLGLIYTFGPLFLGGSFTVPGGLRAGGDAVYVSLVALCSMWGVRVVLSWLFAGVMNMGVVGINLAMCIEWVVRSQLYRGRLKGERWHGRQLIERQNPV